MKKNVRKQTKKSDTVFLDSFLFRFSTRTALGIIIVIAILTLIQCSVKKPQSPQWSTSFNVPLVNREYPIEELVAKIGEDDLKFDSLGDISFSFTEPIDTVTLANHILETDDLYYVTGKDIGLVDIDPPPTPPVSVSLSSIVGLATSLPNDSAAIASIGFNLTNNLPVLTTFTEASVDNGNFWTVINNNLGVALDSVVMQVYDLDSSRSISVDTLPYPLPSGAMDSIQLVLDGRNISNSLRLVTFCFTHGGLIDSASSRFVETRMSYSDQFEVSYAYSKVPALVRDYNSVVPLNESDVIDSAGLSQGTVHVTLSNETPLAADLTITLLDIFDGGTPVTATRTVSAGEFTVIDIPLAGYTLKPSGPPDSQVVSMWVQFDSPGSGDNLVRVYSTDQFTLNADITGMQFDYVSGFFQPKNADLNGIQQVIDVPEGFDSLQFANAQISIAIENRFTLPGQVDLTLVANNGKSLNLTGALPPSSTTIISRSDSAVADFLFPMPDTLDITGSAIMAGGGQLGTITNGDFIAGNLTVFAPLEVIVNPSTIEPDMSVEEINQEDLDAITDHVLSAKFIYEIENHLPLGASVNIFFSPDSTTLFATPELVLDTLKVAAAPFSIDGLATGVETTGSKEIYLDSLDIQILKHPLLYVGQQILLEGSDGQVIKFSPDDYLKVTGRIELEYLFDGDF
ncbi:MAG: hypothetical protein P1R58_10210 [bacterium]|nr:hypothetical protein [bacterium]